MIRRVQVPFQYKEYKDCPEATRYSIKRNTPTRFLIFLPFLFCLFSCVAFIVTLVHLLNGDAGDKAIFTRNSALDFTISMVLLFFAGLFVLYSYSLRSKITDKRCEVMVVKHQNYKLPTEDRKRLANITKGKWNKEIWKSVIKFLLFQSLFIAIVAVITIVVVFVGER